MNQAARKVVRHTTCRTVGYFASLKMGRLIPWESSLELDQIKLLETDGQVQSFWAQPEKVEYPFGDTFRKYYPDFRVLLRSGAANIVEVKYSTDIATPENRGKYRAIADHYLSQGQVFRVATEREIRQQPRLNNIHVLLSAGRRKPPELTVFRWQQLFDAVAPKTLAELAADPGSPDFNELLHLARLGHFDLALDHAAIGPNTAVLSGFRPHP